MYMCAQHQYFCFNWVNAEAAAVAWGGSNLVCGPAFWPLSLALTFHQVLAAACKIPETEMLEKWRGVLSSPILCLGIGIHSLRINPVDLQEEKALRHLDFVFLVHI